MPLFSPAHYDLLDLTMPLVSETPSPCAPQPDIHCMTKHTDTPLGFQMMWLGMNDHTGTHMDAPVHFIPGAKDIAEADITGLAMMPGLCLNLAPSAPFQAITAEALDQARSAFPTVLPGSFILVHTGHDLYAGTPDYFNAPFLTPDGMEYLINLKPQAIGVNAPTVDDRRTQTRPIHLGLLQRNIAVIEGVTQSSALIERRFWASALPLKIPRGTGSPLRLVAFLKKRPS